jgi:hypothetical protein
LIAAAICCHWAAVVSIGTASRNVRVLIVSAVNVSGPSLYVVNLSAAAM